MLAKVMTTGITHSMTVLLMLPHISKACEVQNIIGSAIEKINSQNINDQSKNILASQHLKRLLQQKMKEKAQQHDLLNMRSACSNEENLFPNENSQASPKWLESL